MFKNREMLVIIVLLAMISSVFATKYAGEFTDLGVGVRAAGMGGSFTMNNADLQALWWNPAGLTGLSARPQVYLMHAEMFGDLYKIDVAALGKRLGETQWAIGFFRNATENLPFTDTTLFYDYGPDRIPGTGDPGEGNGTWDPGEQIRPEAIYYRSEGDYLITIGAGRQFGDKLRMGLSLKNLQSYIGEYSAFGFGLDVGAQYQLQPDLLLGASVRDITGTHIRWSTGTWETKAPSLWWGARYEIPIESVRGGVAFNGEFETRFENYDGIIEIGAMSLDPHIGAEFTMLKRVHLRAGIDRKDFAAGFGLGIAFFRVDYAFVTNNELDNTHRIGISLEIPKVEKPEPKPEPEGPGIQRPPTTSAKDIFDVPDGEYVAEIFFSTGSADLDTDSRVVIEAICPKIIGKKLYIEGHTDFVNINTPEFPNNIALSKVRAQNTADFIAEKCGISKSDITVDWFGQDRPKYENNSSDRGKNRRVEIYIIE